MEQKSSDIKNRSIFLAALLGMVMGWMFLFAFIGGMRKTGDAAAHFAMELAGYTKRIQMADTKGEALEAVPILGTGIEQPVFLSEEMQAQEQGMLGFKMASYNRENHGTLYVELVQKNVSQSFQMEMEQVRDNGEMRLLFEPGLFQVGELKVRIYAPESTGENCVAVYAASNAKGYLPLFANGEKIDKNAVIYSYIPSKYARSDFIKGRNE